jgi:hypothetical protein
VVHVRFGWATSRRYGGTIGKFREKGQTWFSLGHFSFFSLGLLAICFARAAQQLAKLLLGHKNKLGPTTLQAFGSRSVILVFALWPFWFFSLGLLAKTFARTSRISFARSKGPGWCHQQGGRGGIEQQAVQAGRTTSYAFICRSAPCAVASDFGW